MWKRQAKEEVQVQHCGKNRTCVPDLKEGVMSQGERHRLEAGQPKDVDSA